MSGPSPDRPQVFKFGGACFLNMASYRHVAQYIADRLPESGRIVVIVSAMSGTTGNLQKAQRDLSAAPPPELTAALLVTGDTISSVLLATALCEIGVNARHIEARQEGMSASGSPSAARLTRIDPAPLWSALADCDVITMPGGQAVGKNGIVVALGRNSSDLSAVAAAIALNAECCEIFSDVPGVFTADPYLLPEARMISELGYGTVKLMSLAGAKMLHPSAIAMAERHDLPIVCRTCPPDATSRTVISGTQSPVAIIADTRSAVWAFTDHRSRSRAEDRMAEAQLDDPALYSLILGYEGINHLVVPGGDHHGAAHRICAAARERSDLRLLTTVRGSGESESVLVLEPDLLPEARRRHLMHYPSFIQPPGGKARSPLSSMLIHSPGPDPESESVA
jgi:aspartate kinase